MGIFNFKKNAGTRKKTITVYIVEDNVLYSKQLEFFLQSKFSGRIKVQSFPVSEVIEVKLEHGHIPDVIIMDHNLSDKYEDASSGLESLKTIHELHPEILLILHTAQDNLEPAESAIVNGICTYIPKGVDAFAQLEEQVAATLEQRA